MMRLCGTHAPVKPQRGFTLIELLVVIAIIGILASIITASLSTAKAKARDAKRISDIKTIQTALELYYNDHYYFPAALSSLAPTYLAAVPTDPSPPASYKYAPISSTGGVCNTTTNVPITYHLGASLEVSQDSSQLQDSDATVNSTTVCSGNSDFPGQSLACAGSYLGTTPNQSGITENCYDVTP